MVMKFITVRDLRTKPAAIWRDLKKERELVITNNGKPIGLITPILESGLEELLRAVRKARAEEALRSMRRTADDGDTISLSDEEISREIHRYRSGT